jgi:hypothetical protein
LFDIALALGIPLDALMAANGLSDPNALAVGQVLVVPSLEDGATAPTVTRRPIASSTPTPGLVGLPRVDIRGVDGVGDLERETVRLLNSGGVAAMAGWTLEDGEGTPSSFLISRCQRSGERPHVIGVNTVIDRTVIAAGRLVVGQGDHAARS